MLDATTLHEPEEFAAGNARQAACLAALSLLAACAVQGDWGQIANAADAAYLAIGKLAALARAVPQR